MIEIRVTPRFWQGTKNRVLHDGDREECGRTWNQGLARPVSGKIPAEPLSEDGITCATLVWTENTRLGFNICTRIGQGGNSKKGLWGTHSSKMVGQRSQRTDPKNDIGLNSEEGCCLNENWRREISRLVPQVAGSYEERKKEAKSSWVWWFTPVNPAGPLGQPGVRPEF